MEAEIELEIEVGGSQVLWSRRLLTLREDLGNQSSEDDERHLVISESVGETAKGNLGQASCLR